MQGVNQGDKKFCVLHELGNRMQIGVMGALLGAHCFQTLCERLHVNFKKDKYK